MKSVLIIDNFDSFTGNLVHLIANVMNCSPTVKLYSESIGCVSTYDLCIISGGPGHPSEYRAYEALLKEAHIPPILGICLGFQIINYVFGGTVIPLKSTAHGQQDFINFKGASHAIGRYHSLGLGTIAEDLKVFMVTDSGVVMGICHKSLPILGYQFHPESFLTDNGTLFITYAQTHFNSLRS